MFKKLRSFVSHPLFSGSFIMVVGGMVVNVINYIYHLVMGRVLGPVSYGTLLSLYSLMYLISIIPMSSSVAIVKFVSAAKNINEVTKVYLGVKRLMFGIALVSSVLLVLFSFFIADFLRIEEVLAVILVAPVMFLTLITLTNQATSQGLLKFYGMVGPNLASTLLKFILGLLFIFVGFGVTGAVGGVALGMVGAYIYSTWIVKKYINKKTSKEFDLKPFLKFGLPTLLQALAFTSFFSTDVLLSKHFLSPIEAGLYSSLSTLGKIIYFAATPIIGVMFPIVSGRNARGEGFKKIFLVAFVLTGTVSLGVTIMYWLLPKLAVGILFGSGYLAASQNLVWMAIFVGLLTMSYLMVNYFLSINKTKIVILPLLMVPIQIVGIVLLHTSIFQIIQVSIFSMLALFLGLSGYLIYNWAYGRD